MKPTLFSDKVGFLSPLSLHERAVILNFYLSDRKRLTMHTRITSFIISGFVLSAASSVAEPGSLTFVESVPAETSLDLSQLEEASVIWPQAIAAAQQSVRVASFYFSRIGDGKDAAAPAGIQDHLLPSLDALSEAAKRGVRVQILADSKFLKNYSEVPDLFAKTPGAETRILDANQLWGGVLHAKYMLIDDDTFYVGSQNWDWRAMDQIHELGVLVKQPDMARQLNQVYEMDWELAEGPVSEKAKDKAKDGASLFDLPSSAVRTADGSVVQGLVAASPRQALPAGVPWDLPLLVEMIDSASDSLHLQLLSYGVTDREGRLFDDLDSALRRAAVRKVDVKIILSNWSKSRYKLPWIKSLAVLPNLEVRFTNIPEHSAGFIPFARVEHAKYLTVDGQALWIGTSNWSRDYFHNSRNISLFFLGDGAPGVPDEFFNQSWHSEYAESVDPAAEYAPPRRN
ncbi:MAG: phosphatidylserine/phosphatidylglycerophosphate/cardiolipin synthase-like enzyme [Candidatus Krumholzibacteriia bacterium]|jgi:phosphatidylserine/phosphatidylglycerophosphate/cardiolipin synthase-like enzyme